MSYASDSKDVYWVNDHSTDALKNTTKIIRILDPIVILRVCALVTVATDGIMTITFARRLVPGSDTGAVTITSLTVPSGVSAGMMYYKDITPHPCDVGNEIRITVSNTGTNSAFQLGVVAIPRAEVPANQTRMVLSS